MGIIQQLRDRKKSGPGSVEITFEGDDQATVVPLKYPTAADQVEFNQFLSGVDADAGVTKSRQQDIDMSKLAIRLCLAEELAGDVDDELTILATESGGFSGVLVQRCLQLLGVHSGGLAPSKVVKGGKRRGR